MWFGRTAKIRKAIDRALAGVADDDDLANHAPIEALPAALRAETYGRVALALFHDERYAAAKVSLAAALALAPDEVELHGLAATIASHLGERDEAIAAQRRVVDARPREVEPLVALAEMLIDSERIDEAIELLHAGRGLDDPGLETRLAEALFVSGRHAEALELLDQVCAFYDVELKRGFGNDWQALKARADEASRLLDDVFAELHGREATIELAAADGKLDARAGVNYRLLGARLAATGSRVAEVLELQDPDATERRGRDRLAREPGSAAGLVLVGIAQLRAGQAAAARKTFERACEADGRCFAAFLGLGAALDHESYGFHKRARRFELPAELPAELAQVVPDLAALTEAERRVVWASAQPLAPFLPVLAARGVTLRILPIDVRATDIDLFERVAGERAEDHRSYDAITGVATHGGAVAKIEELLDIGEHGWTFAHELAHLAFFHLDEDLAAPLLALHARALEVGYASTEYALSNPDEFFAVSYTDYLLQHHDLAGQPLADDAGIRDELVRYFDHLSAAGPA